jgi:hypothetical protein
MDLRIWQGQPPLLSRTKHPSQNRIFPSVRESLEPRPLPPVYVRQSSRRGGPPDRDCGTVIGPGTNPTKHLLSMLTAKTAVAVDVLACPTSIIHLILDNMITFHQSLRPQTGAGPIVKTGLANPVLL